MTISFLEFLEIKRVEFKAAACAGDRDAAQKLEILVRILDSVAKSRETLAAAEHKPAPKHYGKARRTLDDFDKPGMEWGNA